jgi:hypothetical protein
MAAEELANALTESPKTLAALIAQTVDAMPPLTDDQRTRLAALLRSSTVDGE